MFTAATTTSAVTDSKHMRARALYTAAGAVAAVLAWTVEVPLMGVHLTFRFGRFGRFGHIQTFSPDHIQTISAGQVIGVTVAASLLGWLMLALLERRTPHARRIWTTIALVALAASLALPLAVATTTSAAVGLVVLHLTVGATVIPAMARTARAH
jgi:hypothetical protein